MLLALVHRKNRRRNHLPPPPPPPPPQLPSPQPLLRQAGPPLADSGNDMDACSLAFDLTFEPSSAPASPSSSTAAHSSCYRCSLALLPRELLLLILHRW